MTTLRMYHYNTWQVRTDGMHMGVAGVVVGGNTKNETFQHGSQVLDWLWQGLAESPTWAIWVEDWFVGSGVGGTSVHVLCLTNDAVETTRMYTATQRTFNFMATEQSRREAYDFIQPHIMMLGPM